MKKLTESIAAKITAIILSYIMAVVLVLSVAGIALMVDFNFYTKSQTAVKKDVLTDMASSEAYNIYGMYDSESNNHDIDYLKSYYSDKNIYFTITDSEGNEIVSTYDGEEYQATFQKDDFSIYRTEEKYDKDGDVCESEQILDGKISIRVYVPSEMVETDRFSLASTLINVVYPIKTATFAFAIISLTMFIVLISFLYCSAGHRKNSDAVQLNYSDRLPFDVYTALVIIAAAIIFSFLDSGYYRGTVMMIIVPILATISYFILLAFTMTFATRLKTKTLIKNTLIYKLTVFLGKWLKKGFGAVKYLFRNLSLVKKTVLILAGIIFVELILVSSSMYYAGAVFFWWMVCTAILSVVVLFITITLQKIKLGGEKIASGDLDYKIDTKYMYYDFKDFAVSLNNINLGLQNAVNEKMKSEHFKTELITNVSHDIKTPLTSIINYVDLIKKEEPENEKMRQYIDVLDRQSGRLKKLIEDLVEASKASTGNLAVNLTECEVGVLLSQTIGEFDERLAKANLIPVLKQPQKPVKIMADGRHLWRVFDNLMSNVCKYSQGNTRVYMDVSENNGKAVITFRNISKYELNISSEELMERFVRGDSSRNTEGSGLGLSIARSLVELQSGQMELKVDGDLFKVILTFDAI